MAYKLGRQPRAHDPLVPRLRDLLGAAVLPPLPATLDWTSGMPTDLGMMLNDFLGDCAEAAIGHAIQVWSFNAQPPMRTQPDDDIEMLYEGAAGYVPNEPVTDQGTVLQDLLKYLMKHGAPVGAHGQFRNRIAAFVEVDVASLDDVKRAISDCGAAYIGFNVPAYLMATNPPDVWDVDYADDNRIIGGHCVVLAGWDATSFKLISWGQTYRMSFDFFTAFVDEVYAIADHVWIDGKGTTPGGLSLAALEAAMLPLKNA